MRSSTGSTTLSGWLDQRREQVLGRDLGVVQLARQGLGGAERLAGLAGQLVGVERHALYLGVDGAVPKVDNDAIKFIPCFGPEGHRRGTLATVRLTGTRSRR